MSQVTCDYTQLGWDLPFRDAQHSNLAPVRGPGDGATVRWAKSIDNRMYPVPFTVAGHVGHFFMTDNQGSVSAYDGRSKGSFLWTHTLLNASQSSHGTVDMTPIVLHSEEDSRRIVVSSCQQFAPHTCVLAVLDEDGQVIWSTERLPENFDRRPQNEQQIAHSENVPLHASDITWSGRIHQTVPMSDGELIIVPLCPKLTVMFRNDCKIFAFNSDSGALVWSQPLPGPIRGDLLVSRGGILLVPMCDYEVLNSDRECLRVFSAFQADTGALLWFRSWNTTLASTEAEEGSHETQFKTNPKNGNFGLQLNSQFTGMIADGTFVTIVEDTKQQVWAYGMNMASGTEKFRTLIPGTQTSRHFVACAATPSPGKPRQLFFMANSVLISLDTAGTIIWKNSNVSNIVRSMVIDTQGALYVATSRLSGNSKYVGALDVYDAKGGRYSFSLTLPECSDPEANNMTIIPSFTITSQRWVLVLCKSKIYALYSNAVPAWAWITLSVFFVLVFATIFLLGYLYHRKHNRVFEVVE